MRVRVRLMSVVAVAALLSAVVVFAPGEIRYAEAAGPVTIISPDVSGNVGQYSSVALNALGHPVVSYYDATNGDLKILTCGDATCSSGNTITSPDTAGDVGLWTSLQLTASGFPVVSYRDETNDDLKILFCGDATCSSGNTTKVADSAGNVGLFSSMVLNASGFAVVAYFDATGGDLKIVKCSNAACSSRITTSPVTAGNVGAYPSIQLNASGFPVVAHFNDSTGDLELLICGDTSCLSGNTEVTLDTGGVVGLYPSLELDSSGSPVVSYLHNSSGDLRVVVCGDALCSTNNIAVPDTVGSVGWYSSLELDGSDNPIVSYHDNTNGDLKVMVCVDPLCAGGEIITTPDTAGDVGEYTSMILDSAGSPVVSYWDSTNADLKVLNCGSSDCLPCPSTFDVDTEAEVDTAIRCYNFAGPSSVTTITFVGDVILSTDLTDISNATDALLVIVGDGHTLDGQGNINDVLHQTDGHLDLSGLTLTGGDEDGIEILGGSAAIVAVTATGNSYGVNFGSLETMTLDNSTIASNSILGLYVATGAAATVRQTTIVDNALDGADNAGAAMVISGSIIARNGRVDCTATLGANDLGGNVFSDTTCSGSAAAGLDASLAVGLGDNGCPSSPCTQTIALLAKSQAINAAGSCGFAVDQRIQPRPISDCDAGSFEFQIPAELCDGQSVTHNLNYLPDPVKGTGGNDVMLGTPGDDRINGIGGNDTICGGDGDDVIRGGAGEDRLHGEAGQDDISAGGGNDIVDGGLGDDTIRGQGGADTLNGRDGDDIIDGQGAADRINGDEGADSLNGQNGADIINGGDGVDVIKGQTGPDTLRGQANDDSLTGGSGNDTLFGGGGTDVCAGNTGPADQAEAATCESTPGVEVLF